jgi:hypothetical protein
VRSKHSLEACATLTFRTIERSHGAIPEAIAAHPE